MRRQLLFSGLTGAVLFLLLLWIAGPIPTDIALAVIGSAIVQTVQLGTGARNLLTGIKLDLVQIEKTRLEIEKLVSGIKVDAMQIEKARGEMAKTNEELQRLSARVYEATPEQIIKFGQGETFRRNLLHEGKETKL
jgi:hypothetical protein